MCGIQYVSCLERIARSVGVTVIDEDISVDEATRQIVERAKQLYDCNSQDNQTLIHTLQHKLKSLKERLDSKVIDHTSNPCSRHLCSSWWHIKCIRDFSDKLSNIYIFHFTDLLTYFRHFICGMINTNKRHWVATDQEFEIH